jgi:microcystin-dependent protein
MSCTNCYNGCAEINPDTCIKYTGNDIVSLGIYKGDPLAKVETIILTKLQEVLVGNGIDLSAVTLDCTFLSNMLVGNKTLISILNVLIDAACSLHSSITEVQEEITSPVSYNTSCLTGLPTNPTTSDVLQALLNKVCSMNTTLNGIAADYVKASQLNVLITNFLVSSSGVQQKTKLVPYVAYEYYGPLSNFDSAGIGLAATGFEKVYICNGQNGTPDKRGRVAVGAVQGVPGGALDAAVDPLLPQNAGTNYVLNQKFGQSFVTLNTSQMPAHTHSATDSGHAHTIQGLNKGAGNGTNVVGSEGGSFTKQTNTGFANITISSAGGNLPHDNRQPSIAANFIMYIP